ncbi:hypothetical protein [Kitasatospora sp. MAP5-34]|uniref:hypothetical protein n=1 Tax=Kitasatospora sp. MAP5-34 TaxID=3035102 RepID=UPI002475B817|nr:hypothetical protein [Kitasatospora sp. MAP5-34]MDH6577744.1 hypothetical protein [Kitasatospora sp. MAP5-34]
MSTISSDPATVGEPESVGDRSATAPGDEHGPAGNERLAAATGAVLLLLLAAQGVTILFLGRLLAWHFFIGMLLIGPVCLKLGTVGYRFVRYYTGAPAYRRKGPPALPLRLLAPLVVATSVAVLVTGGSLALLGPDTGAIPVLFLHKASFVCWGAVMSVHVLCHLLRLPRLIGADLRRRPARHGAGQVGGAALRWSLLALSLGTGVVIALAGAHLVSRWDSSGQHSSHASSGHRPGQS